MANAHQSKGGQPKGQQECLREKRIARPEPILEDQVVKKLRPGFWAAFVRGGRICQIVRGPDVDTKEFRIRLYDPETGKLDRGCPVDVPAKNLRPIHPYDWSNQKDAFGAVSLFKKGWYKVPRMMSLLNPGSRIGELLCFLMGWRECCGGSPEFYCTKPTIMRELFIGDGRYLKRLMVQAKEKGYLSTRAAVRGGRTVQLITIHEAVIWRDLERAEAEFQTNHPELYRGGEDEDDFAW